jgi:hypothetical protein
MEKKYPINIEPNNSKHQEIILKVCKAHGVKSLELTTKHIALMSDCISEYIAQHQPPVEAERGDGWISVDDQLPTEGGRYWCYVEEVNSLGVSHFQWNCFYHEKEKRWSDNFVSFNVTHWRKLPDPPKRKEVSHG